MNWGWKIFFITSGFVILILFMVFKSMQQDFHLVAVDYYDKEIKYQDEINKIKNANALAEGLEIDYLANRKVIELRFPPEHLKVNGDVYLFRPSDAALDKKYKINQDGEGYQYVSVKSLDKGLWQVKVSWSHRKKEYQQEKNIIIQ